MKKIFYINKNHFTTPLKDKTQLKKYLAYILTFIICSCASDSTPTNPNPSEETFKITYNANLPTGVSNTYWNT